MSDMTGIVVLILRILLVASLYGFLGWALMTIWRDLRVQGQSLSSPQIPSLSLARIPPTGEAKPIEEPKFFDRSEVIVGRSNHSDEVIQDETVSARHARLSYHHQQWWVEDLKSTNGTFLNDMRVLGPTVIVSGDELRCGQISLLIGIEEKGRS